MIRTIEPARRLQLGILDACRDNPFLRSMRRTVVSRSVRSGHGEIDEKMKVLKATRNRQEPYKYGLLGGVEHPLVPAAASPLAPTAPQPVSTAESEWQQYAKDTKDTRLLEVLNEKHKGDPLYVRLTEARIEDLKREEDKRAEAVRRAILRQRQEESRKQAKELKKQQVTIAAPLTASTPSPEPKPSSAPQLSRSTKQKAWHHSYKGIGWATGPLLGSYRRFLMTA